MDMIFGNISELSIPLKELVYVARIAFAALLGMIIGIERMLREKEAGIRTHFVVAMGAALTMVVSKYAFGDVTTYDGARIAAQVVSGIGFLGAGIIIYRREALHGVTTAAGIWLTAGIGLAIGAGMYIVGAAVCIIDVIVQTILHRMKAVSSNQVKLISVDFVYSEETVEYIKTKFGVKEFARYKAHKTDDKMIAQCVVKVLDSYSAEDLSKFMSDNDNILSVERLNGD